MSDMLGTRCPERISDEDVEWSRGGFEGYSTSYCRRCGEVVDRIELTYMQKMAIIEAHGGGTEIDWRRYNSWAHKEMAE